MLERLRLDPANQEAWSEFVRRYGPQIYRWCRRWQLQEADAEDVTQAVLLKLSEKMRTFRYDAERSFRAYLKTLARYAWCDFLETCQQAGTRLRHAPCSRGVYAGRSTHTDDLRA